MQWQIIHLTETESTNTYARENILQLQLPCFIYADYQTKGRGQGNTSWYSDSQKNLLCSIVLPIYLPINKNNYISRWISIVLSELLISLQIPPQQIKIKWPNDILVHSTNGFKKIAGILIENIIEKNNVTKSILGIGLNINQTDFQQLNKTATSLALITNQNYHIHNITEKLMYHINKYYPLIELQQFSAINQKYLEYLYGWQSDFIFKYQQEILKGQIIDLNDDGTIHLKCNDKTYRFANKDIEFLY
ncbi:MAG: biotin--[acetyl-CoA-carboxylase] ligase [Bacteroidota bacterium]